MIIILIIPVETLLVGVYQKLAEGTWYKHVFLNCNLKEGFILMVVTSLQIIFVGKQVIVSGQGQVLTLQVWSDKHVFPSHVYTNW